jgi:hypothetical protein
MAILKEFDILDLDDFRGFGRLNQRGAAKPFVFQSF